MDMALLALPSWGSLSGILSFGKKKMPTSKPQSQADIVAIKDTLDRCGGGSVRKLGDLRCGSLCLTFNCMQIPKLSMLRVDPHRVKESVPCLGLPRECRGCRKDPKRSHW